MILTERLALPVPIALRPLLVGLFASTMVVLGVLLVIVRVATPWDGVRWTSADVVAGSPVHLEPAVAGTGIYPGDTLVSVNGQPVGELQLPPFAIRPSTTGQPAEYEVVRDGQHRVVRPASIAFDPTLLLNEWPSMLLITTWLLVGLAVFVRRPMDPAAQVMVVMGASFLPGIFWAWMSLSDLFSGWVLPLTEAYQPAYFLGLAGVVAFVAVYPHPTAWVARHRRLVLAACALPAIAASLILLDAQIESQPLNVWWSRLARLEQGTYLVGGITLLAMLPVRYRALSDPRDRRSLLLIVGSLGVATVAILLLWSVPVLVFGTALVPPSLSPLAGLPVPIAIAVAVLRYNAFDLKLLLNRSLVYGGATVAIALTYVLVVGAAILTVHERFGFAIALLATGLVIVIAQPVRDGLQRAINRLMFGDRDDPYSGVLRLKSQLESALLPEQLPRVVVETIADSLRLSYVAIELTREGGPEITAAAGKSVGEPVSLPLVHRSELVGRLLVAPRAGEEQLSDLDMRALHALVPQVSAAIKAVALDLELRSSRERLVAAREEERRRLGRELHDGLGPTLAGSLLQLRAARVALADDPDHAQELLDKLEHDSQQAILEVRRLARDLRPPALDALGLLGALRERVDDFSAAPDLQLEFAAPDELPALPAAVEMAAYRIVLEAVANVISHAQARCCRVALSIDSGLTVSVSDDGDGFEPDRRPGVGLRSMTERAAELGGTLTVTSNNGQGTVIEARLPLATSTGAPNR